jgi:hypothetical protein
MNETLDRSLDARMACVSTVGSMNGLDAIFRNVEIIAEVRRFNDGSWVSVERRGVELKLSIYVAAFKVLESAGLTPVEVLAVI